MKIFEQFSNNFDRRLCLHDTSAITEDCIRYDFFGALVAEGHKTEYCILEFPHPHESFKKRKIDFVQWNEKLITKAIVEMKYYKRIPSGTPDKTGYMSKLIVDFLRLNFAHIGNSEKYFIMATDNVFKTYLTNEKNGFSNLLSAELGSEIDVSASDKKGKTTHFNKQILEGICATLDPVKLQIRVTRVFEKSISKEHSIYIFKING